MFVCIMGDSCTGKSTLAKTLAKRIDAEVITGKDYLRLAKDERSAEAVFKKKAESASQSNQHLFYVITEKTQLSLVPDQSLRILVTASLETIKDRFAKRMGRNFPKPVEQMLERKYGMFEREQYDCRINTDQNDFETAMSDILEQLQRIEKNQT